MAFQKIQLTEAKRKAATKRAFPKRPVKGSLKQVSDELGVSISTLRDWRKKYFPKGA